MALNCLEFRKLVASLPAEPAGDVAKHAGECQVCARYAADIAALNARLEQALAVPAPNRLPTDYLSGDSARASVKTAGVARRWYALAASVVVALGLAIGWRGLVSPESLHDAVVAHVYHEPELLVLPPDARADSAQLAKVLKSSHVSLNSDIGEVSHAGLCLFRGKLVAHLVVATGTGSVTVLLLPDERVSKATSIDDAGFVGTIVPAGSGSIAIIGEEPESTRSVETRFVHAVEWSV